MEKIINNVLDIDIEQLKYHLENYDDENKKFIPYSNEVFICKKLLIKEFFTYKQKLGTILNKNLICNSKNITRIIQLDIILYFIILDYQSIEPEDIRYTINSIKTDDYITEETISLYYELYGEDIKYPKILKIDIE